MKVEGQRRMKRKGSEVGRKARRYTGVNGKTESL